MKNLGPAFKVGVTAIAISVLGYWATMMLAKGSCTGESEPFHVYAYFHDATGLVEKSRVQIAGLHVGHIISKELNVRPPRKELVDARRFAKVNLALKPGLTLYSNARIFKRSASLLGEFYLEIDPGKYDWVDPKTKIRHKGEVVKDNDEITNVHEGVTTDRLIRQVSEVIPVLKEIAVDIRAFTGKSLPKISRNFNEGIQNVTDGIKENRRSIKGTFTNMEAITKNVRSVTQVIDRDVGPIVDDIKHITRAIRGLVGRGDKEVEATAGKVKTGLDKLASAIDKLDSALGNVDDLTQGLKDGKGTVGRLLKDEELIDNVEGVVRDAGGFVKSLTGLQTVVGLRTEYNFQASSIKSYLVVEIRPRPDKYYLIELVDDPRGARTVTRRMTRSDDPSKPAMINEELVEVSDAFRISFQFAKRISFATFRFGIKESTGGVGLDIHLFNDRFLLQSDFFDLSANVYPRLKMMLAWEFFKRLYIIGGVDDIFNDRPLEGTGGGRDYFAGLQVRFNDEDLKTLLMFGGSAISGATK